MYREAKMKGTKCLK